MNNSWLMPISWNNEYCVNLIPASFSHPEFISGSHTIKGCRNKFGMTLHQFFINAAILILKKVILIQAVLANGIDGLNQMSAIGKQDSLGRYGIISTDFAGFEV